MISDSDFQRIIGFIKTETGINLEQKKNLVESRLDSFFTKNSAIDEDGYIKRALLNAKGKEAEVIINLLTTNHTFFWREETHFEYMISDVLPELAKTCRDSRDIRIWCAASSTGEEPYTLAMINLDYFGREHYLWDTTILATDISTKVLQKAREGVYDKDAIKKLPLKWQQKYFIKEGDTVRTTDELKNQILFRKLNLVDPFPFKKKLNVIFVRNVLIYFDDKTKKNIVDKMVDCLETGGYIFVGVTESINNISDRLEYVRPAVYRKK